jgi:hypothetical protein
MANGENWPMVERLILEMGERGLLVITIGVVNLVFS